MSSPGRRALRPVLVAGALLAGRYRLTEPLPPVPGDPDDALRWRAVDDVLARPVDVLLLLAHGRRAAAGRALLDAAAAAGTVSAPALAPVYDAALEAVPGERAGRPVGAVDVAYVVSEAVPGTPAADVLRDDEPLDPAAAAGAGVQLAEALQAAHARGVAHGGITPARVVLTADGARLRDLAVAAALSRVDGAPEDDVRALAGCVYALLTARWPLAGGGAGLPPAPTAAGRLCSPRQVRAGVPRHLDDAVQRALSPRAGAAPVRTAAQLADALRAAVAADTAARAPMTRARRLPTVPPLLRRVLPVVLSLALVAVVGVVGYDRGRELGTVQRDDGELETLVDSTPSAVPGGAGARIDLTAAGISVRAFDPPPGDGAENDGAVVNAYDADPGTAWQTERYDTTRFGGLKAGVGLLVDLGAPTPVQQVELGLSPGVDVELRAGDTPPADAAALPVVAAAQRTEAVVRLVPPAPVTARFVLVWITRLPGERASINEMFLVRP